MTEIVPLSAFKDNYIWTLRRGRSAAVVDPGDAQPVKDYLAREGLELEAILATHHHPDHTGGIAALAAQWKCPVYGPKGEPIPALTHPVGQDDRFALPTLAAEFAVLDIPGHTRAHVAYYGLASLFCGDTLFALGCGRLFEGTPQQMWTSLLKLRGLPPQTRVYCAHEYTQSNARFAVAVDPDNKALKSRAAQIDATRAKPGHMGLTTLGAERATNPFLRADDPAMQARWGGGDAVETFAALRAAKDTF